MNNSEIKAFRMLYVSYKWIKDNRLNKSDMPLILMLYILANADGYIKSKALLSLSPESCTLTTKRNNAYFSLHILMDQGLVEHGKNIRYWRLTLKGRELAEELMADALRKFRKRRLI